MCKGLVWAPPSSAAPAPIGRVRGYGYVRAPPGGPSCLVEIAKKKEKKRENEKMKK